MIFLQSLKATARQIIELSDQLGERVHTWNQEESAPAGGYTDRAGYMVYDDIEFLADVYVPEEDPSKSLLRARLAISPKDDEQNLFTIITLDFSVNSDNARAVIAEPNKMSQQSLVALLEDSSTLPSLLHVSLDAGKDAFEEQVGKRFEYRAAELENLSDAEQTEFMTTLNNAYDRITSKL